MLLLASSLAPRAETLEQVIEHVLRSHPRLKAAAATARSANFDIQQAQAGKSPKFGLVAEPGRAYNRADKDWRDAGDLGVRGTYLLYDGKRTDNEIERQRARHGSALERTVVTGESLAGQVADAYIEVLKQERLEKLAASNVAAHTDLYNKVRDIVKFDKGRAYDLTQVGARLQQANVTHSARRGLLLEAQTQLVELIGKSAEPPLQLPRDPSAALPPTQAVALKQLDDHPALKSARAEIEVAQRAAQIASAWSTPRVDLQGLVNSPEDIAGKRDYLSNLDVRFAVQWNPFDGGSGRAAARSAAEQLNAAKDNADVVRRDLAAEVSRFWAQIETRRSRSSAWNDLVKQTAQVREAYWMQFKIGRRSILDLLNAENESFQARLSAESERMEVLQSQYRLLGAMAQLTLWLGLSKPANAPTVGANALPLN